MNIGALAAGVFGIFVVGRILVLGGASADGQGFRRDEQPAIYWSIVGIDSVIVGALLYIGIFNPFEP